MTHSGPTEITLRRPDDWHVHLRDDRMLAAVAGATAAHFGRAIIMPNLVPPVVDLDGATRYRDRIRAALPAHSLFEPLMTLYLTDETQPATVLDAVAAGVVTAVKLYPAGATTNSASGVTRIERVLPVLEAMQEAGIVLCVHGEVTDTDVDIFDREARFIDTVLQPLRQRLPQLRIVLEHVTTSDGVEYVQSQADCQAATLTPHHLMINRNHLLVGGIKPHYYCLPVAKRETHRQALVTAATGGDPRFFLGTDSAPHPRGDKESACGCAGVFNAPNTLSCLATVFEEAGALAQLEAFTSLNGPAFYRLPANSDTLTLQWREEPVAVPPPVCLGDESVVVFDPGRPLHWHVLDETADAA